MATEKSEASTAETRSLAGPRNRTFDLMRLVFAMMVLLSHAPEMLDGNRSRELLSRLTHGALSFGELGVDGFFLLSGFLIARSWDSDPRLGDYLRKRVLRIVPGYVVAVAISVVTVGLLAPATPHFFHLPRVRGVESVLLLGAPETSAVFPGAPYPVANGSLWTIAYEFRCYLLVALAGMTGLLRRRWVLGATALCLLVCGSHPQLTRPFAWHSYTLLLGDAGLTVRLFGFFAVGVCYYIFRDRIVYRPTLLLAALAGLAGMHLLLVRHTETSVLLFGSYLLFYLAQRRFAAVERLRLPDISYGVYLYGWPVEHLWTYLRPGSPWLIAAGSALICLVLGWLSWHLVERPMLKRKPRPTALLPPG